MFLKNLEDFPLLEVRTIKHSVDFAPGSFEIQKQLPIVLDKSHEPGKPPLQFIPTPTRFQEHTSLPYIELLTHWICI